MKKIAVLALVLVMLFSLCACGGKNGGATADLTKDGLYPSVTAAVSVEIPNLLPINCNENPQTGFYWNIYESLFDFNENLELVPDLAKSLEIVDDTHWRVELFHEIYDSQGNHITASDVVFSVNWLRGAGEDLGYELFESVEAVDEYIVEYTWKSAPASTSDVEFPFTRTFVFAEKAFDATTFATKPVTTANYIVKEFVTGSKLVLEANPDYWASKTTEDVSMRLALHKATVKELVYQIIQESATAQIALKTGKIDYCDYIRAVSLPEFEKDDKYVVDVNYSSSYSFMTFNMDPSCMLSNDLNLRLAICYALDNQAIAEAMPGSYTGMNTYGTPWFSDYSADWETDPNYCNTCDTELAKEYLAKSGYAAAGSPELVLACKSVEADQNAVQMMLAQLVSVGINIKLKPMDASTFQTDTTDPANWDMVFFNPMGGKNLVSSWKLICSNVGSKTSDGKDNGTLNFNTDEKLFELYDIAAADATHTNENMKILIDYLFENAYVYPMAYSVSARVYDKNIISDLYYREGNVSLAASTYVGQEKNVDSDYVGYTLAANAGDVAAAAGTYTFSEVVGEGSGTCEYKVVFNPDGTYRIEQHNMYDEDVFIEGTFSYDGETVSCAAPEAGVQGAMDRFLNSGWTDSAAPASQWVINGDGTVTPFGYDPDAVKTVGGAASGEEPAILAALAEQGFDRFNFWEEVDGVGTIPWHVMIKNGEKAADGSETGMCIIVVENPNVGTPDGILVYHSTFTKNGPMLTSGTPDESDDEMKRLGSFWNEDGTIEWQLFGPGLIAPAKMEGLDAYMAAVNAGEIPAKTEPGILSALAEQGFDRFDYVEEVPGVGSIPWHVLIKNGTPTSTGLEAGECILVVENPNVGTADGLLVYHMTFVKDKATITLSEPTESADEMARLGGMWNTDGTSVWTICGAGQIAPETASK